MTPQAQVVDLLKVKVTEGEGTEESPKRAVDYYFQPSGVLLWRWDEWEEEQASKHQRLADSSNACMRCGAPVNKDRVWKGDEGP